MPLFLFFPLFIGLLTCFIMETFQTQLFVWMNFLQFLFYKEMVVSNCLLILFFDSFYFTFRYSWVCAGTGRTHLTSVWPFLWNFQGICFHLEWRLSNLILKRVLCTSKLLNGDAYRNLTSQCLTYVFSCHLPDDSIWGSRLHLLTLCGLTTYDNQIWVLQTHTDSGKMMCCTFWIWIHFSYYNMKFHDLC